MNPNITRRNVLGYVGAAAVAAGMSRLASGLIVPSAYAQGIPVPDDAAVEAPAAPAAEPAKAPQVQTDMPSQPAASLENILDIVIPAYGPKTGKNTNMSLILYSLASEVSQSHLLGKSASDEVAKFVTIIPGDMR